MIVFKNFETGDRITYKSNWLALFLLGSLYLFLLGDYRNMFRYCIPWLWLDTMILLTCSFFQKPDIAGILLGIILTIIALGIWVTSCSLYRKQRIKDLFIDNYIPINSEQWDLLEKASILSDIQFKSFKKLYED